MHDPTVHEAGARLRAGLIDAGWTVDGLDDLLGEPVARALAREEVVTVERHLTSAAVRNDARAALTRLFVLGRPVPVADAVRALPLADALWLGLIEESTGEVRATFEVRPYGQTDAERTTDWYVVSDHAALAHDVERPLRPDHVLGVGGASMTLAGLVPRDAIGSALDLGAGCGVQSLHLALHSQDVVATDISERAARCAALTAALSNSDYEIRVGDLLDPVAGQRFDLIVSNPPFVISPGATHTYRDGGHPADSLGERLCRELPRHLAPGGTAVLLANWLHRTGEDWQERVSSWVAGNGCDAWIVEREATDPPAYVDLWLTDSSQRNTPEANARAVAWLDHLDELRAEAVGFGWIVLHRNDSEPVIRVEDARSARRLPHGREVSAAITSMTAAHEADAGVLLQAVMQVSPDAVVHHEGPLTRHAAQGLGITSVMVAGGWRAAQPVTSIELDVLRRCDGTRTVAGIADDIAADLGIDVDDALIHTLIDVRAAWTDGLVIRVDR